MASRSGVSAADRTASSIDALTTEEHRILAYASAIGSEFDFDLLTAAIGMEEETLAERLEDLVRLGLLRERPGGERFAFADEEVRGRVYRSLTESRLRVLHRKIAEVLEHARPDPPPEIVGELGRHFFLGKVPSRSYHYNRRAADLARTANDPEGATVYLQRVLLDLAQLPGDHEHERAKVAEELGSVYFTTGDFVAADRYYGEALERVGSADARLRARLLLARAEVARENLDVRGATEGTLAAQTLFRDAGDRLGAAETYRLLGRLAFQRGDYRDALDESMRALDLLTNTDDPHLLGSLSIDIGNSFALLGPDVRAVAIEWYERAAERLSAAGDWVELSRAYHNLGVTVGEGNPQGGLEYLERARDAAEKAHDARSAHRALLSGVELRLALGELEEAERDNEQARRLLERLTDDLGLELVEVNRGQLAEKRGQWEDAERAYLTAIEVCRRHHLPADEAEVQLYLARLRFKTRDVDGARAAFRLASELGVADLQPRLAAMYAELERQLTPGGLPPAGTTSDAAASESRGL